MEVPRKRMKLESSPTPSLETADETPGPSQGINKKAGSATSGGDHCSICLHAIVDRTVIPTCAHEFCFECVLVWSEQSRRCPLCSQSMGEHLIHRIRSKYDYQKYYLTPLRTSPPPLQPLAGRRSAGRTGRGRRTEREWGGRRVRDDREQADQLDRAIARRRWIYEHDIYAKHVASNAYTRYRPYPTPAQFSASPELISRMTTFLRRELRVWVNLDVEFLTTFILSIMKSIDIRSESAVKLLAEFLDMDAPYVEGGRHINAEHFAHEVYCYLRSPYRDLFIYDTMVQYDNPADIPPPPADQHSSRRWYVSASRSRSPPPQWSRSRNRSGSESWFPSGRRRDEVDVGEARGIEEEKVDLERGKETEDREKGKGKNLEPTQRKRRVTDTTEETGPGCAAVDRGDHGRMSGVRSEKRGDRRGRSRSHSPYRERRRGASLMHDVQSPRLSNVNNRSDGYKEKGKDRPCGDEERRERDETHHLDKFMDSKGKRKADITNEGERLEGNDAGFTGLRKIQSLILGLDQVESRKRDHKDGPNPALLQNSNHNHTPRRTRNQNLLQSVQAHLGTGAQGPKPRENRNSVYKSQDEDLSVQKAPSHSQREQPPADPAQSARTLPVSTEEAQDKLLSFVSNGDGASSGIRNKMSAHEIMSRARARLAKMKEQSDALLQASNIDGPLESLSCERDAVGRTRLERDPRAGADAVTSAIVLVSKQPEPGLPVLHGTAGRGPEADPPVTSFPIAKSGRNALDLHAKLLNKLEEEKRLSSESRYETKTEVAIPTVSSSLDRSLLPVGIESPRLAGAISVGKDPVDAQALEAKLRVRAQLRVRLAAEKRGSPAVVPG